MSYLKISTAVSCTTVDSTVPCNAPPKKCSRPNRWEVCSAYYHSCANTIVISLEPLQQTHTWRSDTIVNFTQYVTSHRVHAGMCVFSIQHNSFVLTIFTNTLRESIYILISTWAFTCMSAMCVCVCLCLCMCVCLCSHSIVFHLSGRRIKMTITKQKNGKY